VLRISKKLLFLLALLPWTAYATELASLEPQADIQQYRCKIITQYAYLYKISSDYGNILVNEDEVNIFHASKSAVESFDEVLGELKAMDIPVQMGESHQILINRCIHTRKVPVICKKL
jgi:hypothetical protein